MTMRPVVRTHIAGFSARELAERFGTPTYVYDASIIVQRIADLKMFDVVRYAQKACSNLSIINLARRRGALVDAVSGNEVRRALAAGYSTEGEPPPVVYTADIFDRDALALCVERHVHVNCGSLDMIEQFGREAPGRTITLRINPGFGHGHSQKTNTGGPQSKHGIWHTQLGDAMQLAQQYGLTVTGLHMHIGSGTDLEHLAQVCQAMERAALAVGPSIRSISAGGGLPIPYREDETYIDVAAYGQLWLDTRHRVQEALGHPVSLEVEPGRYLVAESGYLIAEVRAVKQQEANLFYLVDAGFNNLARPVMYGAYHPISICSSRGGSTADVSLQDVVIGGPLCESGDIFTQESGGFVSRRSLPPAQVGDLLIIECAGAYGAVMGSNYNSRAMAAEVLIHGESADLIRRRQTFEDMIAGEAIVDATE